MPDYMPRGDPEFMAWLENFVGYAGANLAALGLVPADLTTLSGTKAGWDAAYVESIAAQRAARAATQTKDRARREVAEAARSLIRRLQASPVVSDAGRAGLGITVPDTIATRVGPPISRPVLLIDAGRPRRHVIHFRDAAMPTKKAKPPGVMGVEISVKTLPVGQPVPLDPDDFRLMALATRTPYTLEFDVSDGGKNAHYLLRWVNTRGEKGPWSATASATVGA